MTKTFGGLPIDQAVTVLLIAAAVCVVLWAIPKAIEIARAIGDVRRARKAKR
jgi:hypothetical protein